MLLLRRLPLRSSTAFSTLARAGGGPRALIFDTETTGLVNFKLEAGHSSQPHLLQLAMLLVDTDDWRVHARHSLLVRLDRGVEVPAGAAAVHGITVEESGRFGVSQTQACSLFLELCAQADVVVAHNLSFDASVMNTALARRRLPAFDGPEIGTFHTENETAGGGGGGGGGSGGSSRGDGAGSAGSGVSGGGGVDEVVDGLFAEAVVSPAARLVCTKDETTGVLQLPGKFGNYKWPSLAEAYAHYTGGKEIEGAHDAMVDAEACLEVFKHLVQDGDIVLHPAAAPTDASYAAFASAASAFSAFSASTSSTGGGDAGEAEKRVGSPAAEGDLLAQLLASRIVPTWGTDRAEGAAGVSEEGSTDGAPDIEATQMVTGVDVVDVNVDVGVGVGVDVEAMRDEVEALRREVGEKAAVITALRVQNSALQSGGTEEAAARETDAEDRFYLDCPYGDKDEAKALGARFDPDRRAWYAPDAANTSAFERWIPGMCLLHMFITHVYYICSVYISV